MKTHKMILHILKCEFLCVQRSEPYHLWSLFTLYRLNKLLTYLLTLYVDVQYNTTAIN